MSIKTKNILLLMGVLSVVSLTVVGITYRSTSVVIEKTIADHQLALANNRVEATEIWLGQQMRILNATAESIPYLRLGNNPATLEPLTMAMKAGHFSDVYIGLNDGTIIDGAGWVPPAGYDTRGRPWFLEAQSAGKTSFTTPYIDLVTGELVIALVTPLDYEGELVGVMAADTILDSLVETLLSTKVGETGYLFVTHKDGTIIIHPQRDYVMKAKLQSIEPDLQQITDNFTNSEAGTVRYLHSGIENLLAYKQISNTDWYLCTTIPLQEAYSLSRKTTLLFAAEIVLRVLAGLAILTLVGVGGSGVVLFISKRRFESTIKEHVDHISGISADLRWNINKRQEVETRYQTLFNVANDAILVSKGMKIIECNNKASDLFGGARYSLIGRSEADLFPDIQPGGINSEEQAKAILEQAAKGQHQYYEWTFRRLNGSEFPAEVSLKTLQLNSEELVLTSIRDISKRVFAEKQLLQNQKMAAMGEMLGAIAHQWRQPLNILSTYIASLQAAYFNQAIDQQFVKTLVGNADTQIQFMSKTIDDFRNFFKPSKSKRAFDVLESIDHAIKLMEAQFKQAKFNLRIDVETEETKLFAFGFQSEFVHVVMNILANAKDAIEERFNSDHTMSEGKILVSVKDSGSEINLQVRDNGCGIPKHFLPKVFSPYFTTKGTQSGTGVGLYMSKIIIENEMRGRLLAENTNDGAMFSITLPQINSKEANHA
ncbi:sensor histidine kinase [Malonomonas rubra]|uniref:sensor histidine kinase n=1 Tax=Malonomonas rubra TaxID=57040 RepID=UPI0026EC579F|nr:sensor histidine kinase [Malonomonas rubra]